MALRSDLDGSNNIVVQIEGDRNTVNLRGLAHLTLTRYVTRRRIESDADLLSPYTRSIPLIGREHEVADLRTWLTSEEPISVRVLTGSAGTGKTRLALEICEAMLNEGWDAGFVESGELVRFRNQQNLSNWGWQRPTLVVIDYVAAHAERLSGWLRELADNPGKPGKPLRLLLLERHADTGSGWWRTAFGRGGFGARAVQQLLDPAEPVPIAAITNAEERRTVLWEVLGKKGAEARPPEEGADPAFDEKLRELPWGGEPLFLMMAGVMAADRSMGQVLSLGRTDLAFELAERELARIARIGEANGVDQDFLPVVTAYTTLCRGLERGALQQAAEAEKAALGLPSAGDPGRVARILCDALPGFDGGAGPILPDMIGEGAILRAFEAYDDHGCEVVRRAFSQVGQQVAATVIRTAQDFAGAGSEEPMAWLEALVERDEVDVDQLMLIGDTLPQTSFALLQHAARLTQKVVDLLHKAVAVKESHRLPQLAASLNNLAIRLSAAGRRPEALAPAREAVGLYRALAEQAPDAYRPDLAVSLMAFANCLDTTDEAGTALEKNREAIEVYTPCFSQMPQALADRMAVMCRNYLKRCKELGRSPDENLLGPIAEVLQRMNAQAGGGGAA